MSIYIFGTKPVVYVKHVKHNAEGKSMSGETKREWAVSNVPLETDSKKAGAMRRQKHAIKQGSKRIINPITKRIGY